MRRFPLVLVLLAATAFATPTTTIIAHVESVVDGDTVVVTAPRSRPSRRRAIASPRSGTHQFDEQSHALRVTGADIDTGERLVFGEGELAHVHICRAVAASCAIPIFFRPIRIGERDVVDGGVAGATPIDVAADRGARLVVSINPLVPVRNDRANLCVPLDGGRCARLAEKGVGWVADQTLRMLLAAKLADTLVALQVRHPGMTICSIEPRPDELPMFEHNVMSFAARRTLLDYGYAGGQRAAGGRLEHVRQLAGTRGAGTGDLLESSG